MSDESNTELRERLDALIGQPISTGQPVKAPDPVNAAMIRHWAHALSDFNPAYLDQEFATTSRYGALVSPPVMLQSWTMAPPKLEGIHDRGGVPVELGENPLQFLADAGYTGIIATNSEFEIQRYPRGGEEISAETGFEAISDGKKAALVTVFLVARVTTYRNTYGEHYGRPHFRTLRFKSARR